MAERPGRARQREVRRLLADARHTESMPAEVADRLDRVLADLATQQPQPAASVTGLASRRRRRVTTLLAAAAAVVAVGVGVDQVVSGLSSPQGSSSQPAAGSADRVPSGASREQSVPGNGNQGLVPQAGRLSLSPVLRVRPGHFPDDAARARLLAARSVDGVRSTKGEQAQAHGGTAYDSRSTFPCARADWGPGKLVGVRYERGPAVLVLRPPRGDTQVVDLFRCGSDVRLRSTTLPRG